MRFLRKDICEKLVELGCVSSKEFLWDKEMDSIEPYHCIQFDNINEGFDAFTLCDFLETEAYAVENCRKLKPEKYVCNKCGETLDKQGCCFRNTTHEFTTSGSNWLRNRILNSKDAIQFIEEFVEGL